MKIITFLTDFGTNNGYVAQMKGVACGITDARLLDITHEITPHSIREGAFILQTAVPYYPPGTVHVAVVDPGVGTERKGIIVTTRSHILLGPDNGLLMPAAHLLGDFMVYEIVNKKYMLNAPSHTFHGRDIFAPVAAHITNGVPFEEIGKRTTDFVDLDFERAEITDKTAAGKVMYIDHFGNIITNIVGFRLLDVVPYDKKMMVFIGNAPNEISFVKSYGFVKKGELLATIGSSNYVEIGINQGNAAKQLSVKEDDEVKLLFT
jgi:S-adenosylmethionine hydrolase